MKPSGSVIKMTIAELDQVLRGGMRLMNGRVMAGHEPWKIPDGPLYAVHVKEDGARIIYDPVAE